MMVVVMVVMAKVAMAFSLAHHKATESDGDGFAKVHGAKNIHNDVVPNVPRTST